VTNTSIGLGSREQQVERLGRDDFDVAIVGGGITGAGIALDLAARGQRVALVERGDFAGGTSSRSSKLIHGGLRYLAQYQFGVTREALHERHVLLRLAPALVESLPFVIPVTAGLIEAARIAVGLTIYDLIAGRENTRPFSHVLLADLPRLAPGIDTSGITVAYTYNDCRTDDARLTLAVLRAAHQRGAVIANQVEALGLRPGNGAPVGLRLRDRLSGCEIDLTSRRIVLATGAWGEGTLAMGGAAAEGVKVRPSKGVHLFFRHERLPVKVAFYLPTGVDDRLVFVVPWEGRTLVGTTDTDYDGPLERPNVGEVDATYLLGVLNRAFPRACFTAADVVGAQAGIRPLVASDGSSTHASREERVWRRSDGVVAIAGGKLTTYRKMAEKVADALGFDTSTLSARPTESIVVAPVRDDPTLLRRLVDRGVGTEAAARLLRVYGDDAPAIAELVEADPGLAAPIVDGLAPIRAEVVYAARHEQARRIGDVLARRTRLVLLDGAGARAAAPAVADLMGCELGWDPTAREAALADFADEARQYSIDGQTASRP
jgi:glycerol-3-phosphate dehydrogenase